MKAAHSSVPVHEFIAERWSPRSFDPNAELDRDELLAMLEAARWAPSANNLQPWRYAVAWRGTSAFEQYVQALAPGNAAWAHRASALIVAAAHTTRPDGTVNQWAVYDLGLSVSLLTVQAHAMGLHVHQMGGIDRAAIVHLLQLPGDVEPVVVLAVGTLAAADQLEEPLKQREAAPRQRKPLEEIVIAGLD